MQPINFLRKLFKFFGKAHKKTKFLAILEGVFFKNFLARRRQPW